MKQGKSFPCRLRLRDSTEFEQINLTYFVLAIA